MRTVTFKSVLFAIAFQLGLDPETNLNANEASSITEYINQNVRLTIESKDFPELTPVEARTNAGGLVAYSQGSRSVSDGVTASNAIVTSATAAFVAGDFGAPISGAGIPAGATIAAVNSATSVTISAPAAATATGVTITIGPRTPIGIVYQVYYQNPYAQRFARERFFNLSTAGVQLSPDAPATVWVRFGIQPPVFTAEEWASGQAYVAGNLVYDSTAGDCYACTASVTGSTMPSQDAAHWNLVAMPYIIAEAVKALVYQLVQREEGQTEKAEVEAKRGVMLLQAAQSQQAGRIPSAGQRRVYDGGGATTGGAGT